MVLEPVLPDQEIPVGMRPVVPGHVDVIVFGAQPDDVPCVPADPLAVVGVAGDEPAVEARFQRHAVKQVGVALADGGPVDQRRVGGMLQRVGVVVQVRVVVFHVAADIVVDGAYLFVSAFAGKVQLSQGGGNGLRHLFFLFDGGYVGPCEIKVCVDGGGVGIIAEAVAGGVARHVVQQVVALIADAGVGKDGRVDLLHTRIKIIRDIGTVQFADLGAGRRVDKRDLFLPLDHGGADVRRRGSDVGKGGRVRQRGRRAAQQQADRQQHGEQFFSRFHREPPENVMAASSVAKLRGKVKEK